MQSQALLKYACIKKRFRLIFSKNTVHYISNTL